MSKLLDMLRGSYTAFRSALPNPFRPSVGRGRIMLDREFEVAGSREEMRAIAGVSSWRWSPFSENYTKQTREMFEAYRTWPAEPSVKAALLGKVINVASLGLQVKPSDKTQPRAHDVADYTKHCLTRTKMGFSGMTYEVLIHAMQDGWSVLEKVFDEEGQGKYRGRRVLSDLKPKDTRFVTPVLDAFKNIIGLYSQRGNYGHRFNPDHYVIYTHLPIFRNPTGTSDLRSSFRAMQMIPAVIKLRMIFLDKYLGPFLVGKLKNKALRQRMFDELAQARSDGYIVLEDGAEITAVDLATRGTADFQAALDDLRKEVATGISGAFLHMMTAADPNARGDSEVQKSTTDLFVWMLAEEWANVLQKQVVPDIVSFQFGTDTDLPTISLEAVKPSDIVADLGIDVVLNQIGADTSLDELLDRARRSPPKNEADSVQLIKARLQAAAAKLNPPQAPPGGPPAGPGGGNPPDNPFGPNGPLSGLKFAEPPTGHELFVGPAGLLSDLSTLSRERGVKDWEELAYDSFAEEVGFTGPKKDRLGRTFCYDKGKRIPCPQHPDDPKSKPIPTGPDATDAAHKELDRIIAGGGANALWEIRNLSHLLKSADPAKLEAAVTALRNGRKPDWDVDTQRKKLITHLQQTRREWWAANQRKPAVPKPPPPEPPTLTDGKKIDYQQANPDHPIAVAIRADEAGRKLLTDFLSQFGGKAKEVENAEAEFDKAHKESNKAYDDWQQAIEEHIAALKKGPSIGNDRAAKEAAKKRIELGKRSTELEERSNELRRRRDEVRSAARNRSSDARKWLTENVKPAEKSDIDWEIAGYEARHPLVNRIVSFTPLKPSVEGERAIKDGISFVESLSSGVKGRVIVAGTPTGRAFYKDSVRADKPDADGKPLIALSDAAAKSNDKYHVDYTAEVSAHEFGHHVEVSIPGLADKAAAFRAYRLAGEPMVKLKTLPGGEHYGDDEVGAKDKFDRVFDSGTKAYYVGKSYGSAPGTSTEVVSMGFEQLYRDPVKFAQRDPEYFQWLLTSVRGQAKE